MALLSGLEVLVLGALRPRPHPAHFSIPQAVEVAKKLSPRRTFFVHLGHGVRHEAANSELPEGVFLAYDGLCIETPSATD